MDKFVDAFGHELSDYVKGISRLEIVERSDGYIGVVDGREWYLSEYKQWPKRDQNAMKYAQGRVLDVGCGAGRHALYLQKLGLDVTGIDNSPLAISICRKRGIKKALVIPIEEIDIFKPGCFDSVIMMGCNFGLFGGFKKARILLNKMFKITSPRARIIAETLDPYNTLDPDHTSYHRRNRDAGRMGGQIKIRIRYKKLIGAWFDYLFVSKKELKSILAGTGWVLKKTLSSGGPQYIAIIEKKMRCNRRIPTK